MSPAIKAGWCPVCGATVFECTDCRELLHGERERDKHAPHAITLHQSSTTTSSLFDGEEKYG